jgi:hypothetical protein
MVNRSYRLAGGENFNFLFGMTIMPAMETIETALFEDPFVIYVILGLAATAMIALWHSGGRSGRWLATRLVIVACLAAGAFAVERLVVTDREQIQLALRDIASSVPAGRIDHAMTYIDENYRGWGSSRVVPAPAARAVVAAAVKLAVANYQVRYIEIGKPRIGVTGKLAECKVVAIITYMSEGRLTRHIQAWNVKWIKRPEGWRIEGAEPTTDLMP